MAFSVFGLDLTSTLALYAIIAIFIVDFVAVAALVPSKITDKIIAFITLGLILKGFTLKISEVVEKYQQDEPV